MKGLKKNEKENVKTLAHQFMRLDAERQRIEREARELKKKLDSLKEEIQGVIGAADQVDVAVVAKIEDLYITQTMKHRDVKAYSYDFIEFKVAQAQD